MSGSLCKQHASRLSLEQGAKTDRECLLNLPSTWYKKRRFPFPDERVLSGERLWWVWRRRGPRVPGTGGYDCALLMAWDRLSASSDQRAYKRSTSACAAWSPA